MLVTLVLDIVELLLVAYFVMLRYILISFKELFPIVFFAIAAFRAATLFIPQLLIIIYFIVLLLFISI